MTKDIDQHAADELKLFIDNDADLYRHQTTSIHKNLATKKVRSQYQHDLAVKLFGYLVEAGAKKYAKEFGGTWNHLFNVPTRKAVAEELTREFETEFELGNYDKLLPKKYQKEMVTGQTRFPRQGHSRIQASFPKARGSLRCVQLGHTHSDDGRCAECGALNVAIAKKAKAQRGHSTISKLGLRDLREFRGFLRNATDRQVQGIYDKEKRAGRDAFAELAVSEAEHRGIFLDEPHGHARKKTPQQLEQEIYHALSSYRGRS